MNFDKQTTIKMLNHLQFLSDNKYLLYNYLNIILHADPPFLIVY